VAEDQRELDPLVDELPSRYLAGIDLGTTNSAVAYVDTSQQPWRVRDFPIRQLVAPGQAEARLTLPSFHYDAPSGEAAGAMRLPWSKEDPSWAVGFFARDESAKTPGRVIASAKSWLCHSGVDRTAKLLPWRGAPDVERLSPIEASARYLSHIRDAWNASFPEQPLAKQDIVLTLPASFDEVARELTVEAARRAGLPRVVLIEEPQAAFYAWVYKHADDWRQRIEPGQKILVCDIGGGTSDFTLIRVRRLDDASQAADKIQFHRVAVGDHLILGGDNLDLALAEHIEQTLVGGGKLEPQQWDALVRHCQSVKETLLGDEAPERLAVHLPGAGAMVIGGGLRAEVTRDEVRRLLVDGFLPAARLEEKPLRRQSGFQEFGLPYAPDAAITRYLAAFLTAHRDVAREDVDSRDDHDPARPDVVLFNGGFFAAKVLRERLLDVLKSWFPEPGGGDWAPLVLDHDRLDLAVARGAAYYGMVRRGQGVRIAASLARSYYIGVGGERPTAVCLVPGNAEPG
jgi:molecular chaperone DnaK (HSP70)